MSEQQKPFRVEVVVEAPRDVVWRALTEPDEIRRWFGWDYDGLDAEIRFIFVDHAERVAPDRIELDDGGPRQTIELEDDGPRTIVRVVCPGSVADAEWDDLFDGMEEGWRTFLEQLRHQLERHPEGARRTLYLTGEAEPAAVLPAIEEAVPGEAWRAGRFQWLVATPRYGDGLVSVAARVPLDEAGRVPLAVTVTSYDLDDAGFAAARAEWEARWSVLADHPGLTP
jgi:uncharacterized protein YndB with AHSA1/START domain